MPFNTASKTTNTTLIQYWVFFESLNSRTTLLQYAYSTNQTENLMIYYHLHEILNFHHLSTYNLVPMFYSWPKPSVSSMAKVSFSTNCSYDLQGGRSSRLKQVWERGSHVSLPTFSMQNFCGPLLPTKSDVGVNTKFSRQL